MCSMSFTASLQHEENRVDFKHLVAVPVNAAQIYHLHHPFFNFSIFPYFIFIVFSPATAYICSWGVCGRGCIVENAF